MKQCINIIRNEINESFAGNIHVEWGFLKYAICEFTIFKFKLKYSFSNSKTTAKN